MRLLNHSRQVIASVANIIRQMQHELEFSCGDCEQQRRCGLASDGRCEKLTIQIARDGGRSWKREKARAELRTKSYRYYQA